MSASGFVQVWSTGSIPEGEIARSRLEAEGIQVLVKGEGDGPYRMGPVHLWVPAALEVQARLILSSPPDPISDEELTSLAEGALDEDELPVEDELVDEGPSEEP